MTTIQPTVGRKVHYRPAAHADMHMNTNGKAPLDATIVAVHDDGRVNLVIFDAIGSMHKRTSVELVQEGCEVQNTTNGFCEWMPFQVGQAKAQEVTPQAVIKPQAAHTENKVTPEQITALMARVVFKSNVEGTSTFVHAYLDGKFYLASGHSACVDPANFNAETGYTIARGNAMRKANDKLWELEGYALWKQMQAEPKQDDRKHLFTTPQLLTLVADAESRGFDKIVLDNVVYEVADLKSELKLRGM